MKFLHLADLHLGKRVNGFDMLEDQRFILEQILTLCEKHGVEAVVIAGDIYDTPVPPAAACTLLDWFLTQLAARASRCWPSPATTTAPSGSTLPAVCWPNKTYTLPGVSPAAPSRSYSMTATAPSSSRCCPLCGRPRCATTCPTPTSPTTTPPSARRWPSVSPPPRAGCSSPTRWWSSGVCPPQLSGSETAPLTVGTVDSIDAARFAGFCYAALGHIHRAQRVGIDAVRYAGAPLCYHLDECGMQKSVTLVRVGKRGVEKIEQLPLTPRRAMRHLTGPLARLTARPTDTEDYTLGDPDRPDAAARRHGAAARRLSQRHAARLPAPR